jgi:protein TonB
MGESDDNGVRRYLEAIRRQIQQALVYPPMARRLGIAGSVQLRFSIGADGAVAMDTLRVVGGSDDSLLREGALDTIRLLGRLPPPPIADMTIEVPVAFTLRKSQ